MNPPLPICSHGNRRELCGFSLIELLVVIAVIGVLAAMLMTALAGSKERGRRAACLSNVRQFLFATHLYADENEGRLPSGLSENSNKEDEHTPIISTGVRSNLVQFAGGEQVLRCPWLGRRFERPKGWYESSYGYVIGYNYLGGHTGTPWPLLGPANETWISPQNDQADPRLALVTELNAWSTSELMTFAPHGARGPILKSGDSANTGSGGTPSVRIGAVGGHVGLMDGSASWRAMRDMKVHCGSRLWGEQGCFTAW